MSVTVTEPSQAPAAKPVIEKQTTAGNYFVSNYPPFSFWKPENVNEIFAAIDRPPRGL